MKLFILIGIIAVCETIMQKNFTIPHRGRFFMRTVNEARKILASGVIRQLEPLGLNVLKIPPVGPAADMYRMKWSIELESVAKKTIPSLAKTQSKPCGSYKTDGYSGFYWKYDLIEAIKGFIGDLKILEFKVIEEKLKGFSSAFETLLFLVWTIVTYPKSFPIDKNAEIGPAEALYADRYELGCAFDEYALCLMRDGTNNGTLYKEGVSCTQCPTHCEFTENIDGTIEEGDLCVPPKPGSDQDAKMKAFKDEMQDLIDLSSQTSIYFTLIIAALFF